MDKADSDFRAANAEAAKLWEARTEDGKKLNEAKKAYNASKSKGKAKAKAKSKDKAK